MSIEKMSLATLRGPSPMLDEVLLRCTESEVFHPELASSLSEYASALSIMKEDNPYAAVTKDLTELASSLGIDLRYTNFDDLDLKNSDFAGYVQEVNQRLQKHLIRKRGVQQIIESHTRALKHLEHIMRLDFNFDDIFATQYLAVRFGRLPSDSYGKLRYYNDKPFVIFSYDQDEAYTWCLYLTSVSSKDEIDGMFASLFFERIRIPDYAHGTPEEAAGFIRGDLERQRAELAKLDAEIAAIIRESGTRLSMIFSKARLLGDAFELRRYAARIKDDFVLVGFIPKKEEERFSALFADLGDRLELSLMPADADERLTPPVRLKNNVILRPFEMFVNIYGLPGYKDLDPTAIVGLTYSLFFGIMFGDVGQGLLVCLLGVFLQKTRKMPLGGVMSRIGVSSMIFGFFFGSVFGFEDLLVPVHRALFGVDHLVHVMAPEMTTNLLLGAIGLGIFIILMAMVVNVVLGIRQRDWERAFFSNNGLAGIVFYGGIVAAVVCTMLLHINLLVPAYIVPVVAVPLLIVFFKEPLGLLLEKKKPFPEGIGNFVLTNFFEMFEVILSFFSNTLSFLRVGAFVLVHAGMMVVVFTLSDMVGAAASPVVIIIGNLFVSALEGLIVGIQVLRLEFYEIFSRFFDGDGKPFEPALVDYSVSAEQH